MGVQVLNCTIMVISFPPNPDQLPHPFAVAALAFDAFEAFLLCADFGAAAAKFEDVVGAGEDAATAK